MTDDQKYQIIDTRDTSYDGLFYTCVLTTGIFCRPSCYARTPKRTNVCFVDTVKDALYKGFRPCKQCRPVISDSYPLAMRQLISDIDTDPSRKITQQILRERGLEPATVRRWFMTYHGLSFASYQRMVRINRAFELLNNGAALMDAAMESGFESLSGFREEYTRRFKSPPSEAERQNPLYLYRFETVLGTMLAGATRDGLCLLEFLDRKMLETEIKQFTLRHHGVVLYAKNLHIKATMRQVEEYFAGTRTTFDIPLVEYGSSFQKSVWSALRTISYGQTRTYAQQAAQTASPQAIRATASANGRNTIAIITPCHRVVGNDGAMAGYGGGVWRKQWLIEHEARHRR